MHDPMTIIYTHVAETLPDSLEARKQLLEAVSHVITADHPAAPDVIAQLAAIRTIEAMQAELPLKFKTATRKHNGDGDDKGGKS